MQPSFMNNMAKKKVETKEVDEIIEEIIEEMIEEVTPEVKPEFECANCEDPGRACYKCGKEN